MSFLTKREVIKRGTYAATAPRAGP